MGLPGNVYQCPVVSTVTNKVSTIMRYNAPKSVVKSVVNGLRLRSAMDSLRPAQMDEADLQVYKAFLRSQGGPLKFAFSLLGEEDVRMVIKHIKQSRFDPDCEVPSFLDLMYGKSRTSIYRDGPSDAFLHVFETEVARKGYTQTVSQPDRQIVENVDGVLKTTILAGEATRDVPAFELDNEEQLSNKVVIPYVRDTKGNVLTQAHYKKAMGIPMDRKNEEYDRRPVLQIYITREGGETKLATPVLLKLRHEYDVALKAAVEAMNLAKQKGVFNPEVGAMFVQAKVKKIPWLLLRDAMRAFYQRVANDGKSMTLDTGFGPWPCQGMAFTKGNFALAVRVLKDDMTAEAKKARAAHILAWRKEQEIKRLQQELDGYGDIPLI
jgi:hypothetical protein